MHIAAKTKIDDRLIEQMTPRLKVHHAKVQQEKMLINYPATILGLILLQKFFLAQTPSCVLGIERDLIVFMCLNYIYCCMYKFHLFHG